MIFFYFFYRYIFVYYKNLYYNKSDSQNWRDQKELYIIIFVICFIIIENGKFGFYCDILACINNNFVSGANLDYLLNQRIIKHQK